MTVSAPDVALVSSGGAHVILEASQSMLGQGVRSTWITGYGYSLWIGVLAALQLS
jgi:hypothetical protein